MTAVHIPALKVEQREGLVLVSQRREGQTGTVALHPVHIRHLAEVVGMAPTSDPAAAKLIAALCRRLRVLRERIDMLGADLSNEPDLIHALEQTLVLAELADAFVEDLPDGQPVNPGQAP